MSILSITLDSWIEELDLISCFRNCTLHFNATTFICFYTCSLSSRLTAIKQYRVTMVTSCGALTFCMDISYIVKPTTVWQIDGCLTPRETGWLTVGHNITLTLTLNYVVCHEWKTLSLFQCIMSTLWVLIVFRCGKVKCSVPYPYNKWWGFSLNSQWAML
jgi:hypothetical protein